MTTPLEQNPIWQQDNVTLHSVGIDIGSSGTQVAFSRLLLRRLGKELTSRYSVVRRDTLFQSPVRLTPYTDDRRIDGEGIGDIVGAAYQAARRHPDDIDTGVVILTGEALRRDNAERIAHVLSAHGGDFVCASAGHNMEAMLAAYGSGAARVSHDLGARVLNVDIGGGTTKFGVVDNGRVVATSAMQVGGRLHVVDGDGRLVRQDPAGQRHASRAGFSWSLGDPVTPTEMDHVADLMGDALVAAINRRPLPDAVRRLFLTDPIEELGLLDGVMFSGGVGEYVYGREARDFGDLGRRLGSAVSHHIRAGALPARLLPAGECIRATVLGASQYSVQLSGRTSYFSDPRVVLPRRNLQVVSP
ncbi:MAG: ethanolamine ammonia-lyase reactivating factor EutA, partial [Nocardioidaceae bacterium]